MKIYSEPLARVPVNSKGRNTSTNNSTFLLLCNNLLGPFLTSITGWCSHLGKNMVLCFYAHKRGSMSLVQFTYIQTLCMKNIKLSHACWLLQSLGRYISFLASSMKFPKARKLLYFKMRKVCFLFLSFIHMN